MQEYLEIAFYPAGKLSRALGARMQSWKAKGYIVEEQYGVQGPWYKLLVPLDDESWRDEIAESVAARLIASDWNANFIRDVYSAQDFESAPLFGVIHAGRDIEFPMGRDDIASVAHFTRVDERATCKVCGAGAQQTGPLRLPAADLNRAGNFASIWIGDNAFFMLTERLADALASECCEELPLLEIETVGKTKLKERWMQIVPSFVVPEKAVDERRARRTKCPECSAVWSEPLPGPIAGVCFTAQKAILSECILPTVCLCPVWEGELDRLPDARIISYPARRIWLRGDVGRAIATKKIEDMELIPIVFA